MAQIKIKAKTDGLVFQKGKGGFKIPLRASEEDTDNQDQDEFVSRVAPMVRSGQAVCFPIKVYHETKKFFGGQNRIAQLPCLYIHFDEKDYFVLKDQPCINREFIKEHSVEIPDRFEERENLNFSKVLYLTAKFGSPKPRYFEVRM
jgi:hypothetical protein